MEYMSKEGYDKLVAELHELETVELPRVKDAIAEARDKGDRFMQRVLEFARVIDTSRLADDSVMLLTKVEMTNLNTNTKMSYTIVSPHEADLRSGKLSIKSPIARALLGKKVGDVVEVKVPVGIQRFRIESICLNG